MTDAIAGVGAVLRYYKDAAWSSVGEVTNVTGPSMTKETYDVSNFSSTSGYREFIGGFKDPGTVVFTMNFVRADYVAMKAMFDASTNYNFELVLPDSESTSLEFLGVVTDLPLEVPVGPVVCNVTIKVSGSVTVNSGTESGAPS